MQNLCVPESSEVERLRASFDARRQSHLFAVTKRLRVDSAPRDSLTRHRLTHSDIQLKPLVRTIHQLPATSPTPHIIISISDVTDTSRHESNKRLSYRRETARRVREVVK